MEPSHSFGTKSLSAEELKFLADAAKYLENPSFLMRLADTFGKPLALLTQGIGKVAPDVVDNAVGKALRNAMAFAVRTIPAAGGKLASSEPIADIGASTDFWHKVSVAVSGSAGGFFGLVGLPLELPITTTMMFRSIASIAKDFGENLGDESIQMQCLTVFSYGGTGTADDELGSSYLSARIALDETISLAAKAVAGKTAAQIAKMIEQGTAPAIVSLISKIAARFNVTVTEKVVAQTLPVLGAAAGGTINVAFMDHFNRVARFHFGIRSLERKHGKELVQATFRDVVRSQKRSLGK
jgi:EcsC protein family